MKSFRTYVADAERVDEISKGTLERYRTAARDGPKGDKRRAGIRRASDRLGDSRDGDRPLDDVWGRPAPVRKTRSGHYVRYNQESTDVDENRLERGGPRGYVEREGAKVRDAQDKMLAQSEAEEKKPPFGKGKEDGDDDEEGDEKKPPFGKKRDKDGDDEDDDKDDKKKGDKKPPFGKDRDDKKDDKKEESLAEHYLRLMGYPRG